MKRLSKIFLAAILIIITFSSCEDAVDMIVGKECQYPNCTWYATHNDLYCKKHRKLIDELLEEQKRP